MTANIDNPAAPSEHLAPHESNNLRPPDATPTRLRIALAIGTLVGTLLLTGAYLYVILFQGFNVAEVISLALFVVLAAWVAFPFCTCAVGAWKLWRRGPSQTGSVVPTKATTTEDIAIPRTAIVIPIYNESPLNVFSSILAMAKSLVGTGQHEHFEFFVLSDTQRSELFLEEELTWETVSNLMPANIPIYYRHRANNTARKSGNIEQFVQQWGGRYEFMIVLDADSVMEGQTIVEMTRRAAADPLIGILQVPPKPVNRWSLLARLLQFAADVYGPVFLKGYAAWTGHDGNYFGHNAIIRTQLFAKHCSLPVLPGKSPLGGHILSHDFVEAALMRRAGYRVVTADDLEGSYEECPTTVIDYAIRDQRWCQGNLQHGRLLGMKGWRPVSRIHFLTGLLSYLTSGLWLLFMVTMSIGVYVDQQRHGHHVTHGAALLFGTVFLLVIAPKLMAVATLAKNPQKLQLLGGWDAVLSSTIMENLIAILLAPILAFYHTMFIVMTFLGRSVQWSAQTRDEQDIPLSTFARQHWGPTLAGFALLIGTFTLSPAMGFWCLPISLGLALTIPLAYLLSRRSAGEWFLRSDLMTTTEETARPDILIIRDQTLRHLKRLVTNEQPDALFHSFLFDHKRVQLHRSMFEGVPAPTDTSSLSPDELDETTSIIRRNGVHQIAESERRRILFNRRAYEQVATVLCP